MKSLAALITLSLLAILFVGYYKALDDGDVRRVFFIKRAPTLQVHFHHLFANDADDKPLAQLSEEQREQVIDYCRYRLGIVTELSTQEQLEACKAR